LAFVGEAPINRYLLSKSKDRAKGIEVVKRGGLHAWKLCSHCPGECGLREEVP
jgi:hypothetical protein